MDNIEIASGEASFEILFYQNPQPMWVFDLETLKFLVVNDAAVATYGYSVSEFLGMTIRDVRPAEDLKSFEQVVKALPSSNSEKRPFRHKLKNGAIVHVNIISYPVKFEGYRARLIMVQDVTEATLHIERFNLISKATHDAIWDWNLVTNDLWWNDGFFNMFNYQRQDIESSVESWVSRIHPHDRDRVKESIHNAIDAGHENWADQYRFLRADGLYAHILDRGYTIFAEGKAVRMLGSMMDITQQIELQQAFAETESMLQTIASISPTVLWMTDPNGDITYVNEAWLIWSNSSLDDNLQDGWKQAIYPEDRERVSTIFTKACEQQTDYQADYRMQFKDGSVRWITALGRPRYLANGSFAGLVGSCTDITRQKHMELQKDEFISTVSHELKTPITSIKAYEQLLTRLKVVDDARGQNFLSRMRMQINRLDALVKDLLDISRIESGKLTFHETEFEVNVVLAELVNDLQLVFSTHRLVITQNQSCKIYADRNRVIQLISNLIDNAVKYSPKADRVNIALACDEQYITCSIQDFGRGILKEQQPFIFDRFYQVNDVYKAPGLGIGLYLCKEIVQRLNGHIWFETEYNYGSTFAFRLPRKIDRA
jgi:PAS domain S-box-containing protein